MREEAARIAKKAEGGGNFEKVPWWSPKTGDNVVRILPNAENADDLPYVKAVIHYIGVRKKDGSYAQVPVRCLADVDTNGKKVFAGEKNCPICRKYDQLMKEGDKENARNLRPVSRYLYNVIDITARTVHPYAAPETVHGFVTEHSGDLENPFDLDSGRDWKIVKKVDPRKAKNLGTSYSARPAIKDSALPEKLRHLVEEAMDLKTLYAANDKKRMLEFLGEEPADETAEEFDEDLKATPKVAAKAAAVKAKAKAAEVESSFGDEEEEDEEITFKAPPKTATVKGKVAKATKEDDEDLGVSFEDEELERELKELGLEED
jgi:hypothetical protein